MMQRQTALPRLESGDRLTREEFHRRYSQRPDIRKAELIEGVVFVASPVRVDLHGVPHSIVVTWLGVYTARTPGVLAVTEASVFLAGDNEVQPDAFLLREEPGGPRITDDHYVEGAPQLVVEVAASSIAYDPRAKLDVYLQNRVREYIVWRVPDRSLDWFRLRDEAYVRMEPDENGVIESETFRGLRLNVPKLIAGDLAGVLAELEISSAQ